jgi:hypothetical protein
MIPRMGVRTDYFAAASDEAAAAFVEHGPAHAGLSGDDEMGAAFAPWRLRTARLVSPGRTCVTPRTLDSWSPFMPRPSTTTPAVAALGIAAVVFISLAGCGRSTPAQSFPNGGTTTQSIPSPSLTAGPSPRPSLTVGDGVPPAPEANPTTARPNAAVPTPRKSTVGDAGCPVSAETLRAALNAADNATYRSIGQASALQNVDCYRDFAVAATVPDGQSQPVRVLFGYDLARRTWQPLNYGSAGYCAGYVTKDVAEHLTGCG